MNHYVLGFALDSTKQTVLVIRKRRPDWQSGFFNGIGGKIEENEAPVEAMVREFSEETGVTTDIKDWRLASRLRGNDFTVYVYSAFTDDIFDARTMTDEDVVLMDISEMWTRRGEFISNSAWLIALCLDPDFDRFTPVTIEYL